MFIAFEGIDGSGKTKQAKLLLDYMRSVNLKCVLTEEPTDGPVGALIQKVLENELKFDSDSLQLLFTADRAYHLNTTIKPGMESGINVITDRYVFSTVAYGSAAGVSGEWLRTINGRFPKPDLTFIMEADPKEAMFRIRARAAQFIEKTVEHGYSDRIAAKRESNPEEIFEKVNFLQKVNAEYKRMTKEHPNIYLIDANRDIEPISQEVIQIFKKVAFQ